MGREKERGRERKKEVYIHIEQRKEKVEEKGEREGASDHLEAVELINCEEL